MFKAKKLNKSKSSFRRDTQATMDPGESFKQEIENRFRQSEVNRTYVFPRSVSRPRSPLRRTPTRQITYSEKDFKVFMKSVLGTAGPQNYSLKCLNSSVVSSKIEAQPSLQLVKAPYVSNIASVPKLAKRLLKSKFVVKPRPK